MLTKEQMYERMRNGWRMGRPYTICGNGTLPQNCANARAWLPNMIEKYKIRSLADAGAGDLKFIEGVKLPEGVEYVPYDLIPRLPEVRELDITTQNIDRCDAILCRMVLNHLDAERVGMAIKRFRVAADYLIATQFNGEDLPQRSKQFWRMDLREWLGDPLQSVQDGVEHICALAIWRLS